MSVAVGVCVHTCMSPAKGHISLSWPHFMKLYTYIMPKADIMLFPVQVKGHFFQILCDVAVLQRNKQVSKEWQGRKRSLI